MLGTYGPWYLVFAFVAAVAVHVVSLRVGDRRIPAQQRLAISAAAGLLWPLLLLGVIQLGSFAAYAKVPAVTGSR